VVVNPSSRSSHGRVTSDGELFVDAAHRGRHGTTAGSTDAEAAWDVAASTGARKLRLISDQQYFGLPASAFHAGAQRMLQRVGGQPEGRARIDLECLGHDFLLEPAECLALLRAMLAGGLLLPDGTGYYRPTARFREYAMAPLVAPLSRPRAKMLVDAVCDLAARINADWARNPFEIKLIAVSGAYMSRSRELPELSVWLVLRPRIEKQSRRWRPMVTKGAGLREILAAVTSQSSFIVPRIVAHKSVVPRPFCVVFQAAESYEVEVPRGERLREWGASLGELIGAGPFTPGRRKRRSE
jgi:hypothetical protein